MYNYTAYFLIYAFLGWCTEVAYKAVSTGKFVNRGFLNGPVCPIYGFGMLLIIAFLTPIQDNVFLLFAGGVLLTSLLEFVTGFALEKIFHAKWWDYSGEPLNIKGYVCLKFSIAWGLGCVLIMETIHPIVSTLVTVIPYVACKVLIALGLALMLADTILTVNTVTKLNRQLARLEELGIAMRKVSDELGENIFEGVSDIKEKSDSIKTAIETDIQLIKDAGEEYRTDMKELRSELAETRDEMREMFKETLEEKKQKREERLEDIKVRFGEGIENRRKQIASEQLEAYEEYKRLKERYSLTESEYHTGYNRLLKAFPDMKHTRNPRELSLFKESLSSRKTKTGGDDRNEN